MAQELDENQTRANAIAYARELWDRDRNAVIDTIESLRAQGAEWPFVRTCLLPMLVADGAIEDVILESAPEMPTEMPSEFPTEETGEPGPVVGDVTPATTTLDKIIALRVPQWMRKG